MGFEWAIPALMGARPAPVASAGLVLGTPDHQAGNGNAIPAHSLTGVPAGAVLLIMTSIAAGGFTGSSVNSSPALTWTKQVSMSVGTSTAIYTAIFSAGGSITVTTDWADPTTAQSECIWATGQESVLGGAALAVDAGTGPGFGNPASGSITTTRAGSIIFGVIGDRGDQAGTITYLDGATQIFAQQIADPYFYTFYVQAGAIAAHNMGLTSPSGTSIQGLCLYEIRTP